MPEKTLWIGGNALLWDARCAGIYIGFGIGTIYHLLYCRKVQALPPLNIIIFSALMLTALPLDVLTVTFHWREASNDFRFMTGLLWGSAVCVFLYPAFLVLTGKKIPARSALPALRNALLYYLSAAAAALLAKWNNIFSYALLFALSLFGFVSLAVMLIISFKKTAAKLAKHILR